MVRDDSFSIVWGADFSIVRGAAFSISRGAVFSIVRGDAFSIVRSDAFNIVWGDAFVEMLHRLLGLWRWRCSADWSEVLGEAWGWWRFRDELKSWLRGIAWMRLCAVSGDQVRWPGQVTRSLHQVRSRPTYSLDLGATGLLPRPSSFSSFWLSWRQSWRSHKGEVFSCV